MDLYFAYKYFAVSNQADKKFDILSPLFIVNTLLQVTRGEDFLQMFDLRNPQDYLAGT